MEHVAYSLTSRQQFTFEFNFGFSLRIILNFVVWFRLFQQYLFCPKKGKMKRREDILNFDKVSLKNKEEHKRFLKEIKEYKFHDLTNLSTLRKYQLLTESDTRYVLQTLIQEICDLLKKISSSKIFKHMN